MELIRDLETPIKTRGINHRVGSFRYKELGEGASGAPGNFNLRMVWSQTDFFSPRHTHNFDQVRVQIAGCFSFDQDGVMEPGMVGYFPEGTLYGPQTSQDETVTLVMQIGGPSGNGYLCEAARIEAVERLAQAGRFESGKYFPDGAVQGEGVDAFQAAWEMAHGRRLVYPPQRFPHPLLMDVDSIEWTALQGAQGVQRKRLWDLGEKTVGVDLYQLAANAPLRLVGPASCFIQQGEGAVRSGSAQRDPARFNRHDAIHVVKAEAVTLIPVGLAKILVFTHPVF